MGPACVLCSLPSMTVILPSLHLGKWILPPALIFKNSKKKYVVIRNLFFKNHLSFCPRNSPKRVWICYIRQIRRKNTAKSHPLVIRAPAQPSPLTDGDQKTQPHQTRRHRQGTDSRAPRNTETEKQRGTQSKQPLQKHKRGNKQVYRNEQVSAEFRFSRFRTEVPAGCKREAVPSC